MISMYLNRAADYIEGFGWCQGAYSHNGVAVCALGAIFSVTPAFMHDSVCNVLMRAIGYQHIPTWNDQWGQTKENVIAAFRAAAIVESTREIAKAVNGILAAKGALKQIVEAMIDDDFARPDCHVNAAASAVEPRGVRALRPGATRKLRSEGSGHGIPIRRCHDPAQEDFAEAVT